MKRREPRGPRPARHAAPPARTATRTPASRRWRAWPIALAALAVAAWWPLRHWLTTPPAPAPGITARADDPLASTDVLALYRTAVSLGRSSHHYASLPYFRRMLQISNGDSWQLHFNYGSALYNSTLQVETHHDLPIAVVRSSYERVELMREAVREFDLAERLAREPADLAFLRSNRALMMSLWGLPWETLTAYREAVAATPADRAIRGRAERYQDLMRSPTTKAP